MRTEAVELVIAKGPGRKACGNHSAGASNRQGTRSHRAGMSLKHHGPKGETAVRQPLADQQDTEPVETSIWGGSFVLCPYEPVLCSVAGEKQANQKETGRAEQEWLYLCPVKATRRSQGKRRTFSCMTNAGSCFWIHRHQVTIAAAVGPCSCACLPIGLKSIHGGPAAVIDPGTKANVL